MTISKELQNRITWLVEISTPTLQRLVEMCTGNIPDYAKECCSILLANSTLFDGNSSRGELMKAVITVDELCNLQSDETFSKRCESFLNEKIALKEFPYCKTWKQVWHEVDKSLTILNEFLKKNNKIDEDFAADRRMWQRMVLNLDLNALQPFFHSRFDGEREENFDENNSKNNSTEDSSKLTEEEKTKRWTYEELEELIRLHNASKIEALYNVLPYHVDLFTKYDKTLPYVAVESNAKDVIKVFIQHGFDAFEMISGKNVFHHAAELGRLDILKDLIAYKPDGAISLCEEKHSPLYYGCAENQLPIVEFLLQQPGYDSQPDHLHLALIKASENGHADCVRRLLQNRKCNVNGKSSNGGTALHWACENDNAECVKALINHPKCDVNMKSENDIKSLYVACQRGHSECVHLIMQHPYCDANEPGNLIVAAKNNHVECLRLLLQNPDCPINEYGDGFSDTSLQVACKEGNVECVKLLLQHPNCDVNARSKGLMTALQFASTKHVDCMKLLLEHPECDVNAQDRGGDTALHQACLWKDVGCVELLLQHKDINIHLESITGRCALRQAYGDSDVRELFKKYFPDY